MSDNRLEQAKESWSKAPDQDVLKAMEKLNEYDLEIREIILEESHQRKIIKEDKIEALRKNAQKIDQQFSQTKQKVTELLNTLSGRELKKARLIERNFKVWSFLLMLWLVFGIFQVINSFVFFYKYENAISFIWFNPSEEISPHVSTLMGLKMYFAIGAFYSAIAWLVLFSIRKMFVLRKKSGPTCLFILFAAMAVIRGIGALQASSLPLDLGIVDVGEMQVFPFVMIIFMLALIPFFGKKTRAYYQYTADIPYVFSFSDEYFEKKDSVLTSNPTPELSAMAVLSLLLWPLPYFGLPLAIISIVRISKSKGRLYGRMLAWISVVLNALLLVLCIIGIIGIIIETQASN